MKYKLIQKRNPSRPDEPKKWYAVPVNSGTVEADTVEELVAQRSSLTKGDVSNSTRNTSEVIRFHLNDGKSVKVAGFGTFRLSISSEGTATKEEFTVSHIKSVRIIFTPSQELKDSFGDISFEIVK